MLILNLDTKHIIQTIISLFFPLSSSLSSPSFLLILKLIFTSGVVSLKDGEGIKESELRLMKSFLVEFV